MDAWKTRAAVLSSKASVSCDQPLASNAGLDVLKVGGNAVDAVIAMYAVLSVLQPMATGPGGDLNFMFYRSSDKRVFSVNGSGRTGNNATLDKLHAAGIFSADDVQKSLTSALWISVPGAVAALFDLYNHFGSGKLSMRQLLDPAIKMAEEGVPLPTKTAKKWAKNAGQFIHSRHAKSFLMEDGKVPRPGDVIRVPELAQFYKDLAVHGPEFFYEGDIAERIVEEVQHAGGVLTLEDMRHQLQSTEHRQPTEPLSVRFRNFLLWEMRPNSVGVVVLVAANILDGLDLKELGHNSAEYIHLIAESLKLASMECSDYLADPDFVGCSVHDLLSKETADKLRDRIDMGSSIVTDKIFDSGDTTYLAAVDVEGNGASFIASVSSAFGSGKIPKDCGFVLHNRANDMSLQKDSPNAYGPRKFPLHTIIPSMLTNGETGDLEAVFGCVGGWMQPQAHIQLLFNMVVFGMDPQTALNQPRFAVRGLDSILEDTSKKSNFLILEEGIDPSTAEILRSKGHIVRDTMLSGSATEVLGRGHVIARPTVWNPDASYARQVWWAGADPRCDGAAMGY